MRFTAYSFSKWLLLAVLFVVPSICSADQSNEQKMSKSQIELATLAGGCFWCMEPAFDKIEGVIAVTVGYTGGSTPNPNYQEVSSGRSGHVEAIEIRFDPDKLSYQQILSVFWKNIDPLAKDRQFCDVGIQYRSAIFYHNETQQSLAEKSKEQLDQKQRFKGSIATEIIKASAFFPAEDYHQQYYIKNPVSYESYSNSCGRKKRLQQLWQD